MLRIRLMRMGRKHQPFYRLVVVPRQNKPGRGRYVEKIGWVDPMQHKKKIDTERVQYWIGKGAQPSDTVWNLFVREGIIEGKKRRKGTTKSKKESETSSDSGLGTKDPDSTAEFPDSSVEASAKEEPSGTTSPGPKGHDEKGEVVPPGEEATKSE